MVQGYSGLGYSALSRGTVAPTACGGGPADRHPGPRAFREAPNRVMFGTFSKQETGLRELAGEQLCGVGRAACWTHGRDRQNEIR